MSDESLVGDDGGRGGQPPATDVTARRAADCYAAAAMMEPDREVHHAKAAMCMTLVEGSPAEELAAGAKYRSLPDVLALDRVWITLEGRAKLFDFPAPGVDHADHASGGGDHAGHHASAEAPPDESAVHCHEPPPELIARCPCGCDEKSRARTPGGRLDPGVAAAADDPVRLTAVLALAIPKSQPSQECVL